MNIRFSLPLFILIIFSFSKAKAGLLGGASPGALENARILAQQWTKTMGGSDFDLSGNSIAVHSDGSIYIGGTFKNDLSNTTGMKDFAGATLNGKSATSSVDLFIVKLNASGVQQWVRTLGGTGYDSLGKMSLDPSGNIYIVGSYYNTSADARVVRDFADGQLLGVTAWDDSDVFVAKLNASGTQQWIRKMGGIGIDYGRSVYATATHVFVTGTYTNSQANGGQTKDFAGATLLGFHTSSTIDAFLVKLDVNGTQQWVRALGGKSVDGIGAVYSDAGGDIYVSGVFNNDAANVNSVKDFSGGALSGRSSSQTDDAYVAKLSSAGAQVWIKTLGGSSSDNYGELAGEGSNLYVTGTFTNTNSNADGVLDFAGGALLGKSANSFRDHYLAKLNTADGTQLWIKSLGGAEADYGSYLTVDSDKNVYVVGKYSNNLANANLVTDYAGNILKGRTSTTGSFDTFLIKLTPAGQQLWVKTGGGMDNDYSYGVAADAAGNVFVLGLFVNNSSNAKEVRDLAGVTANGKLSTSYSHLYLSRINGKW